MTFLLLAWVVKLVLDIRVKKQLARTISDKKVEIDSLSPQESKEKETIQRLEKMLEDGSTSL